MIAALLAMVLALAGAPDASAGTAHKSPAAPAPAPFNNEDIVRLVVNGTAEKVILNEIAARKVDFDLAAGVVDELRKVGVSDTVLEAMRRRQAEMPHKAPPAGQGDTSAAGKPKPEGGSAPAGSGPDPGAPVVAPTPMGQIDFVFTDPQATGKKAPRPILAITKMPKGAPRPGDAEIGTVSDLALAILCTTTDHVPDHWDMRTPIEGAPRHEVLLFRPGSTPEKESGFDVLALSRERAGPLPIPAGRHALIVAFAGQQTGSKSWRLLASEAIKVDVLPNQTLHLEIEAHSDLGGTRMIGYRMDQVWKVSIAAPPAAGTP
jgi:hypothetical protein